MLAVVRRRLGEDGEALVSVHEGTSWERSENLY
jgi:hypothetical protein